MAQFDSETAGRAGAKSRGGGRPRKPRTACERVLAHLKKRLAGVKIDESSEGEKELAKLSLVELGRLAKMLRGVELRGEAAARKRAASEPGPEEAEEEGGEEQERERAALRVLGERRGAADEP